MHVVTGIEPLCPACEVNVLPTEPRCSIKSIVLKCLGWLCSKIYIKRNNSSSCRHIFLFFFKLHTSTHGLVFPWFLSALLYISLYYGWFFEILVSCEVFFFNWSLFSILLKKINMKTCRYLMIPPDYNTVIRKAYINFEK